MRDSNREHSLSQSQIISIVLYILGILWIEAWLAWWKELLQLDRLIGHSVRHVVAVVKH